MAAKRQGTQLAGLEKAPKRQRLQLAGLKGVSDSALAAVIAALRADQDACNDTGFSQPSISRALDKTP